jgi:hypothetical protein
MSEEKQKGKPGKKAKFNEPMKTIAFHAPVSQHDAIREVVKNHLDNYLELKNLS